MIFSGEWIKVWGIRILPFPNICSQNDPPCVFLLVAFNKKKIKKSGSPKNTPYKFGGSVKMQIVKARIKALKIKMFKSSPASMSQDTPTLLYMLYFTAKTSIRDVQVVKGAILIRTIDCFLIFFFFLIDLFVFSYVFSSGNWKWTAKDLYLGSLIIACEGTEIRLRFSGCIDQKLIRFSSSTGTFDLIFL